MSTSTLTKQNKLTTLQAIGIAVGVIIALLIMAVSGMLLMFYCFVLKKKSKQKAVVVDTIDITSGENIKVARRNHINNTTSLCNDSTNSKNSENIYEKINNEVLDYNS